MPLIWILVGAILFVLGAMVSYFSGIRALQASRRLADYRVRQRYVVRARWSLIFGFFSIGVAIVLLFFNRPTAKPAVPLPTAVQSTSPSTRVSPPVSSIAASAVT